jgi:hypothetical protein
MRKNRYSILLVIAIVLLLVGCSLPSADASATPTPIPTPTTVQATATVIATRTQTDGNTGTPAAATLTPVPPTANVTPTHANLLVLDYCGAKKDPNLCITSMNLSPDKNLYVIFRSAGNDKSEKYTLVFDKVKYDCPQIANLPDLYVCTGLPANMNRTVAIQLLKSADSSPVAEGSIYLDQSYINTYTPTPTATPTATSTPTITPTPTKTVPTPTKTPTPTPT